MSSYTLAFGPFDHRWRSPQRLVVSVEGDTVVDVHYRGGYNERSCAERLPRLNLDDALFLVSRICGMCSHAHTLAFCQALETLMEQEIPARAAYLRSVVAEIERLASHLEVLTALFDMLGQQEYRATLYDISQLVCRTMEMVSGRRIMPDICLPGGLRYDLDDLRHGDLLMQMSRINRRLSHIIEQITGDQSLSARTVDIGMLVSSAAKQFGLRGPLARASGLVDDMRINQPYAAYRVLPVSPISVEEGGDVYARIVVLLLETFESVKIIEQALHDLPGGQWQGTMPSSVPAGHASSFVESPHGMIRYTVESDGRRLSSVTIDPPRQFDRLLVRALFVGADIDNVMLIALSTDPCLACAEC